MFESKETSTLNPKYYNLINRKPALSWEELQQLTWQFSKEELEQDEIYWVAVRQEKQLEFQIEKPLENSRKI